MPPIRLVKTYIEKLKVAGIELDYEQIIEMHDMGKAATKITDPSILTMTGKRIGCQTFYPLTLAAAIWYTEFVCEWFADDDENLTVCLLFAMANSRDIEVFTELDTPKSARKAARLWARQCDVTSAEAFLAVESLLYQGDNDGDNSPSDWGAALRILQQECGGTRDQWLMEPAAHCEKLIRDICLKYSDDKAPDVNDPALKATYKLNKKYYEILEAHNGKGS